MHLTSTSFGLWEETGAPGGNPHRHGENMQTPHSHPSRKSNTGPCCCAAAVLTTVPYSTKWLQGFRNFWESYCTINYWGSIVNLCALKLVEEWSGNIWIENQRSDLLIQTVVCSCFKSFLTSCPFHNHCFDLKEMPFNCGRLWKFPYSRLANYR